MPQSNNIADRVLDYLNQEETDYEAAAQLGEAALPVLNSIVLGSDAGLASKATYLASIIQSDHKGEVVINAAQHPSALVRVAAAAAAGSIAPAQAEAVLGRLIDDNDIGVTKLVLRSVQAKSLGAKFSTRLKAISASHQDESIQAMAKSLIAR